MRLATDLPGDGEPPAEEEEEEPSSPTEPELLLLRREEVGEEEEAKQGWELELSLYMETGLVGFGEPPQEPT